MSCIKKIKTCEIFGDTIFPRLFLFNQEPQVVTALIQKNDQSQKTTVELSSEADVFKLDLQALNLAVGKYSIIYLMDIEIGGEVIRKTFCIENLSIESVGGCGCGCGCEDERSFDFVVEIKDYVIDVDIVISQLIIGEGGSGDLSSYAKRDSSNITNVLDWQTALNVYTVTSANQKNASQDSAINLNASNINLLNNDLINEIENRQESEAIIVESITQLTTFVESLQNWKDQMTEDDVDNIVNTISEVLEVFKNIPEDADLITLFNQKLDVSSVVNNLTSILTNVPLSAYQGNVLNGLINNLALTVTNKVDKDGAKVLSDFNFSIVEKNKVDGLFLPTVKKIVTPLVVSTVARVVVPELTTAVEANKNYKIEFYGSYTSGVTTTGGSILCTVSGAVGTFIGSQRGAISTSAVATELTCNLGSALTTTGVSAINTRHYLQMEGVFVCSTSGNLVVQWGSEVETSPVTLSMGFFIVTEL